MKNDPRVAESTEVGAPPRAPRRRWLVVSAWTTAVALLIVVVAGAVLRIGFHGPRLAAMVSDQLNQQIRGRVSIGSIEWPTSALPRVITGGWIAVTLRDVEVHDEYGDLVLKTELATAELDVHPAVFGRHDLILRGIRVPRGGYAKIKQVAEPYPAHEFDHYAVSLVSAFYPRLPPAFQAGLQARPAPVFDLRDYRVEGVTLAFELPWFSAIAYGIHGQGNLRYDGSDPLASKLYYSLTPRAPLAVIRAGGGYEVLTDVDVSRLALVPTGWPAEAFARDLEYEATATASSGARLELTGAMLDHWVDFFGGEHRISMTLEGAKQATRLIAAGILGRESPSSIAAERLAVEVTGPVMAPKVSLTLTDVDIEQRLPGQPRLDLNLSSATAAFDLATESGTLADTTLRGLGGKVDLAADFSLRPLSFHASLDITEPLELAPYLPPPARRLLGTRLSGQLDAVGNPQIQRLERLDLRLGRSRLVGKAYRTSTGMIHADGVAASIDRTTAKNIRGSINSATQEIDVNLDLSSRDLSRLLARLGAPALARRVDGRIHVGGTTREPRAKGRLRFAGVPVIDKLQAELTYSGEALRIDSARSETLGGRLSASGRIDLRGRPRFDRFTITGEELRLEAIPGGGKQLTGLGSLEARLSGPVAAPEGEVEIGLREWSMAGDRYADTTIRASAALGGKMTLKADLERAAGGRLSIDAARGGDGELSGELALSSLPVAGLLETMGLPGGIAGGTLSSALTLSGTTEAPTVDGRLRGIRTWLRDAFLGGIDFQIRRVDNGVVHIAGRLLQGRVVIDGTVGTVAPFETDLELRFHRLEADHFLPALAERWGVRAWVSGSMTYRADLLPGTRRLPRFTARLTEVEALLANEDSEGRPAPVRVRSKEPIELSYDGTVATLDRPAIFTSPGGDLALSGSIRAPRLDAASATLALTVGGNVDLGLLSRYSAETLDGIAGTVKLEVELAGALLAPRVTGILNLKDIALKPTGQDAIVTIPAGRIEISNEQIAATGLSVVVVDQYSDETASLDITGGVRLEGYRPAEWTIFIGGELAGKMLLVAAPEHFSSASGKAQMTLALSGSGLYPAIDGSIELSEQDSLTFTPRGLRREIRLTGGMVQFTDQLVELERIRGWIDGEGIISDLSGELNHEAGRPSSLDLSLSARDLPFRVPQILSLSVNLDRLSIVGDFSPELPLSERLEVSGAVEIVDGRYLENWNPFIQNLRPQRTSEKEPPVWDRVPVLGNARLDLTVASPAFTVRNNIADITLSGNLALGGTPQRPRINGTIRVDDGSFKFPGIRAQFSRTSGSVDFSRVRDFPEETPTLKIVSESEYRDLRGQNHLVQLRLTGPIENIAWDLTTAGGLNRGQTLTLIVTGRTPSDFRRLIGDETVGKRPGDFDTNTSTVSSEGTAAAIDRLAKDLVGDQFNLLVGDRLRNLTKFDVVRIELGTASWGIHTEKELTESLRLKGEAAWTLQGWSATGSLENRFNDTVSIDLKGLSKRFNDEALDDQNDLTARLSWRKVLLP